MTAKEGIEQIKRLVFGEQVPAEAAPVAAPEKEKMQDVKTADGKVLVVDKLEVGGNVLIDGIAAPDGDYPLEDGSVLTVAGGSIAEIATKEAEATEPEALTQFKAEFAQFKAEFGAQKQAFAAVQNELAQSKEAFARLLNVVETMSNASVQAPTVAPKAFAEMTPIEKFRATKK